MRKEYDFAKGASSNCYAKYLKGTNTVLLDPELAKIFPDSASVNDALRVLIQAAGNLKLPRKTRRKG